MPKQPDQDVPVRFDELAISRIARQAQRTGGTQRGYLQNYIRTATFEKLERDEASQRLEPELATGDRE